MERIQLSNNLTFQKVATVLIFIIVLVIMAGTGVNIWFIVGTSAVAIYLGYSTIYLADNIEFDSNNMYISTRNDEICVDLADVYMIKLTMAQINKRRMWKIKYRVNGIEKAARCYPNHSPGLDEFIENVRSRNPKIEVKYATNTFDFDS